MEIVRPPFLLDFGDGYLDWASEFTEEVWEQWHAEKSEQFGDRWDAVLSIIAHLRGAYGIHLMDVNPGNITFDEDATSA